MTVALGERRESYSDWWQTATVDGVEYLIGRLQGKRVRLAYGNRHGFHWEGIVREKATGKTIWEGDVAKGQGARGMLQAAGLVSYTGVPIAQEREMVARLQATDQECRHLGPMPDRDWPHFVEKYGDEALAVRFKNWTPLPQRERPYDLDRWQAVLAEVKPPKVSPQAWERFLRVYGFDSWNKRRTWNCPEYENRGWGSRF